MAINLKTDDINIRTDWGEGDWGRERKLLTELLSLLYSV